MESLRVRRLNRMVDWGMTYGLACWWGLESKDSYSTDECPWVEWPDKPEERTVEARHAAALKTINSLSNKSNGQVRRVYRFAKRTMRNISVKQTLIDQINERALTESRTIIMVELFRAGHTEHPLYAALAGAGDLNEVKQIKKQVAALAST